MDVNIVPGFKLIANDSDITAVIVDRFKSLTLTDESGENTDLLEITLTDHDDAKPIALPPTGAELQLFLGYDGTLRKMGLYVCDDVEVGGWPGYLTIKAHAAPWDDTPKGKVDFQSHKARRWPAGTTIGAMVKKMAQEHGMTASVSASLASIALPHFDQSEESDMNLLLRLAKKYDAIAKPAGGVLVFAQRGAAQSASGQDLPRIPVTAIGTGAFRMSRSTRESAGTVVAYWHSKRAAKRTAVTVGTGEPVKRLKMYFPTEAMALAAAKAEIGRRARGEFKLSINFPGNPQCTAESVLDLSGFRDGVNGEWLVKKAQHSLSKEAYRCVVDCERPNSDQLVQDALNGAVTSDEE